MAEPDLDNVRVIMDIPRVGELIAAIATQFAYLRGIEPPDYEGDEMKILAVGGWRYIERMYDRAQFAESVAADLAALDQMPNIQTQDAEGPEHRSEFGL